MPALSTSTCVIISSEMLLLRANCLWDISLEMRILRIFLRRVLIAISMQLLLACSGWLDACVELNLLFFNFFYLLLIFIIFHFGKSIYYVSHHEIFLLFLFL